MNTAERSIRTGIAASIVLAGVVSYTTFSRGQTTSTTPTTPTTTTPTNPNNFQGPYIVPSFRSSNYIGTAGFLGSVGQGSVSSSSIGGSILLQAYINQLQTATQGTMNGMQGATGGAVGISGGLGAVGISGGLGAVGISGGLGAIGGGVGLAGGLGALGGGLGIAGGIGGIGGGIGGKVVGFNGGYGQ